MNYIGIDIGGTKCALSLGNENGRVKEKIRFATMNVEETLQEIKNGIHKLGSCTAIGISCGGPLDSKRGIIMSPPNLPGWDHIDIVDMLEKEFGVPVFLQNDADACALAEWKFGAGRGSQNMVFCTFGTGLGAGLILNGALYTGACDMAGELGHIRMAEYGPVGYGKIGAFEGFCSGGGIAQLGMTKAKEMFQCGKQVSFCENVDRLSLITAQKIAECAKRGEEDAIEVYHICGQILGKGLAIIVDLLNPERIVLGSVYARSGELLKAAMYRELKKECLLRSLEACKIVSAELGEQLGDIAALSVAINGGNKR